MSVAYLYESAKDVLKWSNLDVKLYVKSVMSIGSIYHLSDKEFENYKNESEYLDISLEELEAFYEGD